MRLAMPQPRLLHHCQIPPEVRQTVRAAEQGGEVRRVHQHDVAGALLISYLARHLLPRSQKKILRRIVRYRQTAVDRASTFDLP